MQKCWQNPSVSWKALHLCTLRYALGGNTAIPPKRTSFYVTTQNLSVEQLEQISEEVGAATKPC